MKHIKTFKIFESSSLRDDVRKINDILNDKQYNSEDKLSIIQDMITDSEYVDWNDEDDLTDIYDIIEGGYEGGMSDDGIIEEVKKFINKLHYIN